MMRAVNIRRVFAWFCFTTNLIELPRISGCTEHEGPVTTPLPRLPAIVNHVVSDKGVGPFHPCYPYVTLKDPRGVLLQEGANLRQSPGVEGNPLDRAGFQARLAIEHFNSKHVRVSIRLTGIDQTQVG